MPTLRIRLYVRFGKGLNRLNPILGIGTQKILFDREVFGHSMERVYIKVPTKLGSVRGVKSRVNI